MDPATFYGKVKSGGDWDFIYGGHKEYEPYGNFIFGVAGRATGWFENGVLFQEAGRYQFNGPNSNPAWGTPGTRFFPFTGTGSYGDDPKDQFWIQQGIRYHENNYPPIIH